jgi:peptidoglycan/xylan/chitin deacetylase (PgdA/CDA1 family)
VTFDDGFAGVRDHAFPVLADLGVPATVFAATAFIGTSTPFPFDPWGARHAATTPPSLWRPLDWPACREMEASGLVSIGSHTHTHRDLRSDPLEFERDVSTSLAVLDEQLGSRARALAYPFGSVADGFAGPELARAARRAGATCGFTTEYELVDLSSDRFRWGRFECVESDDGATCAAKLAGWYAWMGGVRRGFQRVSSR